MFWSKAKTFSSLDDKLKHDAIISDDGWLQGCGGLPAAADSCAYEPVQRLLAVGTYDGRIKIYGGPGVERTIYSACTYAYGTRQLEFIPNRGVLIRLSEGGFLESWSLTSTRSGRVANLAEGTVTDLTSIRLEGDMITSCAVMRREPFVLLGCASGCVRFAALVSQNGMAVPELRQPTSLRLLPYKLPADELKGAGDVEHLSVRSIGPIHHILALNSNTGLVVWDLRRQEVLLHLNARAAKGSSASEGVTTALRRAGKVTAATWLKAGSGALGGSGGDFATGHESGDVLVWSLQSVLPTALGTSETIRAQVLCKLRVVPGSAEPVQALRAVGGRRPALVVLGGQANEQPDALALLALPQGDGTSLSPSTFRVNTAQGDSHDHDSDEDADGDHGGGGGGAPTVASGAAVCRLPWLGRPVGFTALPSPGAVVGFEDASCVLQVLDSYQMALTEVGGQKLKPPTLHAPPGLQQVVLASDRGDITCTVACTVPVQRRQSTPAYAITLHPPPRAAAGGGAGRAAGGARGAAGRASEAAAVAAAAEGSHWQEPMGQWVAGGSAAKPDHATTAPVLVTGHKSGSVYMWDLSGEQPRLMLFAPSATGASGAGSLRAVTALAAAPEQGIVCTGHAKGEVRVYQFADLSRNVTVTTLTTPLSHEDGNGQSSKKTSKISEDAGLQLKLKSVTHETEITCICYSPAAKALAVADKAGTVSVIDLTQPAVLWMSTCMDAPTASLTLAPLPAPAKKYRSASSALDSVPEGEPLQSLLLVASDGRVLAITSETGENIGKAGELKPKNRSQAVYCEPLDSSYCPLWMSQGQGEPATKSKSGNANWRSNLHGGRGRGGRRHHSDTESEESDAESDEGGAKGKDAGDVDTAPASHLLVVSDQYIRVYSVSSVVSGERSTEVKVSSPHPLLWAMCFAVDHAPALIALAQPADDSEALFLVYSLPSLTLVSQRPLSHACAPLAGHVGHASVTWTAPANAAKAKRSVTATRDGVVFCVGPANELLQLHITTALPPIASPMGVYDQELAMAAHAAAAAHEQQLLDAMRRAAGPTAAAAGASRAPSRASAMAAGGGGGGGDSDDELVDSELEEEEAPKQGNAILQPLDTLGRNLIGGVFKGVSKVVEGASKGVAQVAKGVEVVAKNVEVGVKGVGKLFVEEGPSPLDLYNKQYPDLLAVVCQSTGTEEKRSSRRNRNYEQEEDGIPITTPQPLVVPDMGGAAQGAAGTAGRGAAAAGSAATPQRSRHTRTPSKQKHADSDTDSGNDETTRAAATTSRRAGAGSGASRGRGGSAGDGDRGEERGAARRPARPAARASVEHDDQDSEEEQGPGFADKANKLAQDMKAGLTVGAQAVAGTFAKLSAGDNSGGSSRRYEVPQVKDRSVEEVKSRYGKGGGAGSSASRDDRARGTTSKVQGVKEIMQDARAKLAERGERLHKMDEDSQALENEAAGFAELAKQLAEKEKNRKWWQ